MNIIKLYQDYNIAFTQPGESSNAGQGWVQTNCPFCDDPSDHLGYNLDGDYFNCWRCGFHDLYETLAKLTGRTKGEMYRVAQEYGGLRGRDRAYYRQNEQPAVKINRHPFKLPTGTTDLTLRHRTYLKNRGFDPDKLEREWGLMGTGPVSSLKTGDRETDYRHRILAPIWWDGNMVSFQTRDITGRHSRKYLACPKERELVHHKDILYMSRHTKGEMLGKIPLGVCVEGITDVWRFGGSAFATFGIEYTEAQIREMTRLFTEVIVIFDPEPQAQKQAQKLVGELQFMGTISDYIIPDKDPGSMTEEEAKKFLEQTL
jgi:hypothetical protein